MGRIKTTLVKRASLKLFNEYRKEFTNDFASNKQKLLKLADFNSKKILNYVTGYVTRLVKITKDI
jgi:ribosomal protein S17E